MYFRQKKTCTLVAQTEYLILSPKRNKIIPILKIICNTSFSSTLSSISINNQKYTQLDPKLKVKILLYRENTVIELRKDNLIALHNIYLSSLKMAVSQPKRNLPNLLNKITLKLNSLFFQKLVLLEQQKQDYQNVRHYDLECEAIDVLLDFFRKKQQNLLCKAFNAVKEGKNFTYKKIQQKNPKTNGTTRRTYLNTTFTASECSPINEILGNTIRSHRSSREQSLTPKSQLNKTSIHLQDLLNRVKLANMKQDGLYSFRQTSKNNNNGEIRENFSHYISNKCTSPKTVQHEQRYRTMASNQQQNDLNYCTFQNSQKISTRSSRRQFIMDKFNQIQNRLHELNDKNRANKPKLSQQILNEINTIKQRFKLQI